MRASTLNTAAGNSRARNADGAAIGAEGGPIDRLAARIKATEPMQSLLAQCRWVMWRYAARNGGGKPSKAPYVAADPNRHASSKDPRDWCDFETAIAAAKRHGFDGVSFALTPTVATTKPGTFTPTATTWIAAFDLDDCRDPKTGALASWAQDLIEESQSYVEITPSGTGLRIIGYGRADPPVHNKLKAPGGGSCEIYRKAVKFIAVTGDPLDGWHREFVNLDAAIDNHRRTTPQAPDRDGGEDRPADYSHRSGNMPDRIIDLVREPDAQDRSKEFFRVVRALKQHGWNAPEIEALFADNIDGIASKYWNRLRQEVDRAFDKESQKDIEASPEPDGADHAVGAQEDEEFIREVRRLAVLSDPAYERVRIQAAKKLGVRAAVLDKLRASERKEGCTVGQGKQLEFPAPEPWPEPVDGAELLDEIEATFSRFIVCEPVARVALALWSCGTWFEPVAQVAPILNIASPEMRCGKSTALSVTRKLAKRPLTAASISPAAVFRTIEKHAPTLLVDEADTFLHGNEELRGLINSGHTRDTAFVVRTVGDDHEPKRFATWGFKAIVGIGKRAATIEDRSITISLKRKLCGEKVERLRHANPGLFETLTRKLARFAEDNGKAVAGARPHLPEALNDREQDNWELLIAIAEVAGGAWPQNAREAALALSGVEVEPSHGAMLLADIREVFEARGEKEIASEALVAALSAMRDRPWGECNRGKALTQNLLARRLKPFGVSPKNVGPKHDQAKGYKLEFLADAFARYLPTFSSVHPSTINEINELDEKQTVHQKYGCTVGSSSNTLNLNEVHGCTVPTPPNGDERVVDEECEQGLPTSKPRGSGPETPPMLGPPMDAAGSNDVEPKVWEEL